MPDQTSALYEEAKAAVNKAETACRRTRSAYNRLHRERFQAGAPVTEAEAEAKRAYDAAIAVLSSAREHLQFVQSTLPKPKAKRERNTAVEEDGAIADTR